MIEQYLKGSPVKPAIQVHDGKWLITWQFAFWPHVPGQGSMHLFRIQARFEGQSEFNVHSGLQPSYGLPIYSGRHTQEPAPFRSLHSALIPHGDGLQGFKLS